MWLILTQVEDGQGKLLAEWDEAFGGIKRDERVLAFIS